MSDEEPLRIDLCCGRRKPEGFLGVDIMPGPGVDIVHDLTKDFPFENNQVDYLRAHDAIEHLPDKIKTMNEIWRVCKPGATVDIFVPSTDGRGAFQDPTHVSFWNMNSFLYYSVDHPDALGYCRRYGFKGGFKIKKLFQVEKTPSIIYVTAILEVVK